MNKIVRPLMTALVFAFAIGGALAQPVSAQTAGTGKYLWNDSALALASNGTQRMIIGEPFLSGNQGRRTIVAHVNIKNSGSSDVYANCIAYGGDGSTDHADVNVPAGKWVTVPLVIANNTASPGNFVLTCGAGGANLTVYRASAAITYVSQIAFSSCNVNGICN